MMQPSGTEIPPSSQEIVDAVRRRILEEDGDWTEGGSDGECEPEISSDSATPARWPAGGRRTAWLGAGFALCLVVLGVLVTLSRTGGPTTMPSSGIAPPEPATAASAWQWFDNASAALNASWPSNPEGTAWYAGGEYHLLARQPGRFVAIGAPTTTPLRDVTVSARFRKVGGPPGGGYGIIVRDREPSNRNGVSQEGHFYVLEAGDKGEYGIWRREQNSWIDLVAWTPTSAVRQGEANNELRVVASGERLRFLINGAEVGSVNDATLRDGGVGIFVGGDFNEVVVEHFSVVKLPS
jgi:hypothetical protein